jgi:hypothetical protein
MSILGLSSSARCRFDLGWERETGFGVGGWEVAEGAVLTVYFVGIDERRDGRLETWTARRDGTGGRLVCVCVLGCLPAACLPAFLFNYLVLRFHACPPPARW